MIDWHAHCDGVLVRAKASLGAAEAHGLISARVCAGGSLVRQTWLDEILGDEHEGDPAQCEAVLSALVEETHARLGSSEMRFEPFLPADDHGLSVRLAALRGWCGGFLYGLGSCPDLDWTRLGEESREAVADLTALSRVTAQAEPSDAAEADYFELVEYVRVGVMMINEDLHHDRLAAARPTGTTAGV